MQKQSTQYQQLTVDGSDSKGGRIRGQEAFTNLMAFWVCGLLNNYGYVIMLSGAEDILPGMGGAILACDIAPALVVKATAPFWAHYFSYNARVIICTILSVASFYVVALFTLPGMRLFGVVLASISSGWGEITFLALASRYDPKIITAWSSGTGFAGIAGAGWYLLFSSLDIPPSVTLCTSGVFPLFYSLAYFCLLEKPQGEANTSVQEIQGLVKRTPSQDDLDGNLHSDTASGVNAEEAVRTQRLPSVDGAPVVRTTETAIRFDATKTMTTRERLALVPPLCRFMVPLMAVYFAEYTINMGVNNSQKMNDLGHKSFYVMASFIYQVGVFLSRSSGSIFPLTRLWPLPCGQFALLGFFLIEAITQQPFRLAGLVLPFVFIEGLLGGLTYVNTYALVNKGTEPQYREFSMAVVSMSDTIGIMFAAIVSLFSECAIQRHNGFDPVCIY